MPVVLMRIAGVYDDHCHSIPISQQIKRIYENQFIGHIYSGDITHGAAFVHMEDMVEALVLAVERRKDTAGRDDPTDRRTGHAQLR